MRVSLLLNYLIDTVGTVAGRRITVIKGTRPQARILRIPYDVISNTYIHAMRTDDTMRVCGHLPLNTYLNLTTVEQLGTNLPITCILFLI